MTPSSWSDDVIVNQIMVFSIGVAPAQHIRLGIEGRRRARGAVGSQLRAAARPVLILIAVRDAFTTPWPQRRRRSTLPTGAAPFTRRRPFQASKVEPP
jgi:hypothetical protein